MNNYKILELLNEKKYDELKQKLIEEININASEKKDITKAIIKLSKVAEKEQRTKGGGYIRESIAGAYVCNGSQMICNGIFGVRYNTVTDGTTNAKTFEPLDLAKIMPKISHEKIFEPLNIDGLNEKIKIFKSEKKGAMPIVSIKSALFNAEYVRDVVATLDDPVFVLASDYQIYIRAKNGDATILGLRPQMTKNTEKYNEEFDNNVIMKI